MLLPSRGVSSFRRCLPSCFVSAQLQIDRSSIFLDTVLLSLSRFSSWPFPSFSLSAAYIIISSSSHLRTWPYHLNLLSCTLSLICTTHTSLCTSSFIILSNCLLIAECSIPDKTRTASLLYGLKNEPFRKFIDVKSLKIDLVWAVKSRKIFFENGKRVFKETLIKQVFRPFYLRELWMSFWKYIFI